METVALHSRGWDAIGEELEYAATTLSRYGREGRADDLTYLVSQIQKQREDGADPDSADLDRYTEKMRGSV